jgi:hypothetical protein
MSSLAIATVLVFAAHSMVAVGRKSNEFVNGEHRVVSAIRNSAEVFAGDLRRAAASRVTIATLPDQNHAVTLQMPLGMSGGSPLWGVHDPSLGATEATRMRAGWFVRYTVVPVTARDGVDRQLRRQLVTDTGVVARQWAIAHFLQRGSGATPGFRLTLSGSMYHVAIFAAPSKSAGGASVRNLSFDVALRN